MNTLAITTDEFRPANLWLGWNSHPEWDIRNWITKTTETEYYKLVGDYGVRREHFLKNLEIDDESDKKKVYAKIIEKNAMFVDEPIFAKELQDKAKNILNKYAVGKLLVSGDNRYLCDDLMRLLGYIVKCSEGESEAYNALEKEFLTDNFMYAPRATYEENEFYTLLRSPHIARNEEAIARPLKNISKLREKYLSHLHYVVMVDSRSLIPERLGGADFDGDILESMDLNGVPYDVVSEVICFCIANKRENTGWVHLPVANFDCYYNNTNFSKKWLSKIPDTILEREVASGICRVKLKI